MQLDPDPQGQGHLTLEPDEHICVHIGSTEVILIGCIVGTPGEGPLVQITPGEPTARLETKHMTLRLGIDSLEVRIVSGESDEP
jgi:hypothetical protein